MAYFLVDSFKLGIDRRRARVAATPGSLWVLDNCHITPGGDIEKRKAFVMTWNVAGTVGLASIGDRIFVFGSGPTGPAGSTVYVPPVYAPDDAHVAGVEGLNYMQLHLAAGEELHGIYDWDVYDGHLYVVAIGAGNLPVHYFDGQPVTGGKGYYVKVFRQKVYGVQNKLLNFSSVGDPRDWAGTGSGFINPSVEATDAEFFRTVEIYFDQLALFSERSTQMWAMDPDPALNQQMQVLRSIGTYAPLSVRQYGEGDVLMLSDTGIRSLRAKDSSLAASVTDVGSPVDVLVRNQRDAVGKDAMALAIAVLNPATGRFWMICQDKIYILSSFPGPDIVAWSTYTPGFPIEHATETAEEIAVRSVDDKIYLYGGTDTITYDSCPVTVETPYMGAAKPATFKNFTGFDIAVTNTWDISVGFEPNNELAFDLIGSIGETTFNHGKVSMQGFSTHAALKATCVQPGPASIAQMALHYELGQAE